MAQIPPPPTAFSPQPHPHPHPHPHSQPHPHPHPPPSTSAAPPPTSIYPPPPKRQRISPGPGSPYGLTTTSPSAYPHPTLSGPPTQVNGHTMPPQGAGAMGPPSRPADKPTTALELTDVLSQAGVDVLGEENALIAEFSASHSQEKRPYGPNNGSSFTSTGLDSGTLSAGNSLPSSQGSQGQLFPRETFPLAGPAQPSQTPAQLFEDEWKSTVRRHAQTRALHLDAPFLFANSLRLRMVKRAYENGVRLPQDGFSQQLQKPQRFNSSAVTGADGTSIVAVNARHLERNAPLAEILALLSLATGERIRGLIEDSATLAKGRKVGAQGVVPAEWADLAVGNGAEPGTARSVGNALKRSHDAASRLHTPNSDNGKAATSVSFPNEFAKSLRGLSSSERDVEEQRHAKRARRSATAPAPGEGGSSKAGPATPGTPSAGGGIASGTLGERAPEVEAAPSTKKMTKREQSKAKSARLEVAHQQQSANNTARMMLGGGGGLFGKKKTSGYAWMTGGSPGGGGGGANAGSGGSGASTPGRGGAGGVDAAGTPGGGGVSGAAGRRIGDWREDRDRGAGVQLRDWAAALEADGKERRSLASALSGLK